MVEAIAADTSRIAPSAIIGTALVRLGAWQWHRTASRRLSHLLSDRYRKRVVPEERIVSIGFLTLRDLEVLGRGFTRHFPVQDDDLFADLIERLDKFEAVPIEQGVALIPRPRE